MSNGYSTDLRLRALRLYESGKTQVEVGKILQIASRTLCRWIKLKRETGDVSLRPRPKVRSSRKLIPEALQAYFTKHPDHFLWEAQEHFKVNASAIGRACRKFGITRKKNDPLRRKIRRKKTQLQSENSKAKS